MEIRSCPSEFIGRVDGIEQAVNTIFLAIGITLFVVVVDSDLLFPFLGRQQRQRVEALPRRQRFRHAREQRRTAQRLGQEARRKYEARAFDGRL